MPVPRGLLIESPCYLCMPLRIFRVPVDAAQRVPDDGRRIPRALGDASDDALGKPMPSTRTVTRGVRDSISAIGIATLAALST